MVARTFPGYQQTNALMEKVKYVATDWQLILHNSYVDWHYSITRHYHLLRCSYSNTVRQHFLDMVRHYAHTEQARTIFKEIEDQNPQPESSEPETGGLSEHNPTQRAKRTCPDGYILEQVPSDGDCFFHCFVKGLMGKGKTSSVQELREIAAKHILQSTDLFEDLLMEWKDHGVVKPDETITQSLAAARILAGKEWATNIIIHILSNHFKIGVKIHTQRDNGTWEAWSFPYEFKEGVATDITEHMHIVLHWWEHFDYIRKVADRRPPRTRNQLRVKRSLQRAMRYQK